MAWTNLVCPCPCLTCLNDCRLIYEKRVVVTGIGIVSPLGIGIRENWERYLSGTSGIKEIVPDGMDTKIYAGKVSDAELEASIPDTKKVK
ncbi:MAG: hypothetical protein HS132_06325 [Planctomycetia bacterium]|nr:hypothetical protein [Planctomycetia bacterium]